MALLSADVAAVDPVLAAQYDLLRGDVRFHTHDGVFTAPVSGLAGVVAPLTLTGLNSTDIKDIYISQTIGNGLTQHVYQPVHLDGNYIATDQPYNVNPWQGIVSTLYYGGRNTPVSAVGTAHATTFETVIRGSGNALNEMAAIVAVVRNDMTAASPDAATPGRIWGEDFSVHGAIGIQQSLISGLTQFINNYYNGQPSGQPSYGMAIVTEVGAGGAADAAHLAATTYPVAYGLQIVGEVTGGTLRGFETGIRVGGAGTGWNVVSSRFGTGLTISDVELAGILLTNPKGGGATPTALVISAAGWGAALDIPNNLPFYLRDSANSPKNTFYASNLNDLHVGWVDAPATNGAVHFWANGADVAQFNAQGSLLIGMASVSGYPVIAIGNGTPPGANPTAGGYLYVDAGALKYRGSAGTITTLAVA